MKTREGRILSGSFFEKLKSGGKEKYIATAAVVVLIALLAIVIRNTARERVYDSYVVERAKEKADSVSRYEYADGFILRYSVDGASLIDKKLETRWNVTYSMSDPRADVAKSSMVIYDRLGSNMRIFDREAQISEITADLPILLARVSAKNTVAALLSDGSKVDLVYYDKSGSKIAAGEFSHTNPGYPVSMAVSPDGRSLAVSCLSVAGGSSGSVVRYYYFGGGAGGTDNLRAEFSFGSVIAPEVKFLGNGESIIFRDDGFTAVRGAKNPKEVRTVTFDKDITSVFADDSRIGIITDSEDSSHRYVMDIFRADGSALSSGYVDLIFDKVRLTRGGVVFCNSSEFALFGTDARLKFRGRLTEGNIADSVNIGHNRVLVLTDRRMEVISLR